MTDTPQHVRAIKTSEFWGLTEGQTFEVVRSYWDNGEGHYTLKGQDGETRDLPDVFFEDAPAPPASWCYAYRRTHWAREDGAKLYEATLTDEKFMKPGAEFGVVTTQFWSKHPVIDLRQACSQPRTPQEIVALLTAKQSF